MTIQKHVQCITTGNTLYKSSRVYVPESWLGQVRGYAPSCQRLLKHEMVEDVKPGDRFHLVSKEARVEWWARGDRRKHADTEVYLPF